MRSFPGRNCRFRSDFHSRVFVSACMSKSDDHPSNLGRSRQDGPQIRRGPMRLKLLVAIAALIFTLPSLAQVLPSAGRNTTNLSIGGGLDWWTGDWGGSVKRFGPSAWATAEIWHGVGINAEGHSMIFGG